MNIQEKPNKIALMLQITGGAVYIFGMVAGLILGDAEGPHAYPSISFLTLACWVSFFVTGTLFLGFSEIIKLLQKMVDAQVQNETRNQPPLMKKEIEQFEDLPKL